VRERMGERAGKEGKGKREATRKGTMGEMEEGG
jgi:hypothetical protein